MVGYYLVSYDLKKKGQDYTKIENALENFGFSQRILTTTWIVRNGPPAKDLLSFLKGYIDDNDELFVTECTENTAWVFHDREKNKAMDEIIP